MKKSIPLFPLKLVPFPGEDLNLHIYEERYRQMIHDCDTQEMIFGVVPIVNETLANIGTTFKLVELVKKYKDGRLDIRTKGFNAFELVDYKPVLEGKLYPGGEVLLLDDDNTTDFSIKLKILKLREELFRILKLDYKLKIGVDEFLSYDIAHKLGLSLDQEVELLTIRNEKVRLVYLYEHLQGILPSVREIEEMKRKVKLNGHFKDTFDSMF